MALIETENRTLQPRVEQNAAVETSEELCSIICPQLLLHSASGRAERGHRTRTRTGVWRLSALVSSRAHCDRASECEVLACCAAGSTDPRTSYIALGHLVLTASRSGTSIHRSQHVDADKRSLVQVQLSRLAAFYARGKNANAVLTSGTTFGPPVQTLS